ncbi:MAG: sigma-70 family RNA polymerase sigma factor [Tepidisphaeraceae bacterium]
MTSDHAQLRAYADCRSPEVFAGIVKAYVDLVYSTALRQVRDRHLAEDVTQAVFLLLSQKAGSVPGDRPVSAWLHRATCYVAANARRAELSRRKHENHVTPTTSSTDESEWDDLAPLLDAGVRSLKAEDRDAVLLRFFEKKSHREVAAALSVSEESAAKRVARAVEKLRQFFRSHGLPITASTLALHMSARTTEAAPLHSLKRSRSVIPRHHPHFSKELPSP